MLSGKSIVITIDGPAGAGKSTVAKELATRLHFFYLDTGAMYRALTLKALRNKINLENEAELVSLAQQTTIDFSRDESSSLKVLLDGEDVSRDIRSLEVTNNTFYIARAPQVRTIMVEWQRRIGEKMNVIVEGRDTGTVVFPNAVKKFYLDADVEERTGRRLRELKEQGKNIDPEQLKGEVLDRDHKDFSRTTGPLKKADDAIVIDSNGLTVSQTADKIMEYLSTLIQPDSTQKN